jgi:hypothetical protein
MVDVLNPDEQNPLSLSEGRDLPANRDTTATDNQLSTIDTSQFGQSPVTLQPTLPQTSQPTPLPESEVPISSPAVPRVYPLPPANIVTNDLNVGESMLNGPTIDGLLRQVNELQGQDEFQINEQLSHIFNSGVPFGPNRPLYVPPNISLPDNPYPQTVEDNTEYRLRQAAEGVSPFGIDPRTGEIIPGTRNALNGQPLSRLGQEISQFLLGDIGREFEESLPEDQPIRNLGRRFTDWARGLQEAGRSDQGRRIGRFLANTNPASRFIAPPMVERSTANVGNLSERALSGIAQFSGVDFEFTTEPDVPTQFLDELANNSLQARDLFTGLTSRPNNDDNWAPLQGRFGDFGSAGALSALLYAANVPEGIASGLLYEITNLGVDLFSDHDLPPDRVRLFDALRGRDLGFMNQFDDARYLSFVDNPLVENVPVLNNRVLQNAVGFVADVAWGGIADFGSDDFSSSTVSSGSSSFCTVFGVSCSGSCDSS